MTDGKWNEELEIPSVVSKNNKSSIFGWLLVVVQIGLIVVIGVSGKVWPEGWGWRGLIIASGLLALWASNELRRTKFRATPEVPEGATLITTGPFRLVRNPMYLALIILAGGWLGPRPIPPRILAFLLLIAVLMVKISYEERFLAERFPEYGVYKRTTKRLVPWVW